MEVGDEGGDHSYSGDGGALPGCTDAGDAMGPVRQARCRGTEAMSQRGGRMEPQDLGEDTASSEEYGGQRGS
eukprot:11006892-Alexandrium_andersonii.AAC.1